MTTVSLIVDRDHPDGPAVAAALEGLAAALRPAGIEASVLLRTGLTAAEGPAAAITHLFGLPADAGSFLRGRSVAGSACVVSPLGEATTGPYRRVGWTARLASVWRGSPLARFAQCVVGVSPAEARALAEQRVHPRIMMLPIGVDASACTPVYEARRGAQAADGMRTLLDLRPIHPLEGPVALLKAVADLGPAADGWRIVFAGPTMGDWRMQLEAGVRRKGAGDRVKFEPGADVSVHRELLRSASLVVAPSLHHRGDTSLATAAATGIPGVATTATAPPLPADALLTCAPRREDLSAALREMLTASSADLALRGEAARQAAVRLLDWSVLAPQYAALYHELTQPPGAAGGAISSGSRQAVAGASAMRN
jgi:glycosyltransferase involved in cell wall biosynthesis